MKKTRFCHTGACLLLLLLWGPALGTWAQEYRVFRHKISDGHSRPALTLATQSALGYMWFGAQEGLYRFNGRDERLFPFPEGFSEPRAFCFGADTGYVGFADGRLLRLANGTFSPVAWEEGTPKSEISALTTDAGGRLWIGTKTEGLYVHDGRHLYHFGTEDGLPDLGINDLAAGSPGYLWAATDRGLAQIRFQNGQKKVRVFDTDNGLPDQLITAVCSTGNRVYGGTHSGHVFSVDVPSFRVSIPALGLPGSPQPVTDLWADETELWGLNAYGGIFMYASGRDGESIYIPNDQTGAEGRIRTLCADDEYNIWLTDGTENVLRIFRGILHLQEHEDVSLRQVSSIACDRQGQVYFSSEEGLLAHPVVFGPQRLMRRLSGKETGGTPRILSLYADAGATVWAGTFGDGLLRVDSRTGQVTRLREAGGFLNDNVLGITGGRRSVWAATLGGVAVMDSAGTHFITQKQGMPVGFNYCVGLDTLSRKAWVGTDGGGLVEIGADFSVHPIRGGPSTVYCLAVLPGVGVVFSGDRPGLWGYNGKYLFRFSDNFRFGRITPTGLAVLPDSSVLVLHAQGFERFYPFRKANTSFGESYGIGSFENALNALSVDEYGNCWLASDNRLLRLSAAGPRYRKMPRTVLDEIQVLSSPVAPTRHTFSHNENSFAFRFSGIWFQDEESVTFAYKMDGIDAGWRITGDSYANYPALPPGEYTFRVKSSATGSFIHPEEVLYTFRIRKPFWEEPWFYVPLAALVVLLFYAFIRSRDKRVADRERMLKENAEFRFQVLKNQISPHFLFNSFNTLLYLIDSDKRKASDYTEELSDFFRRVLEVREQNLITLREELDLMRLYASLQQTRFEHALQLDVAVDESYLDTLIPPLSGQMLLENAIKHNAVGRSHPLTFRVRVDESRQWLVFSNNIQLRRGKAESTGIGLKNIIQRYRLLNFPDPQLRHTADTFTVLLPLIHA